MLMLQNTTEILAAMTFGKLFFSINWPNDFMVKARLVPLYHGIRGSFMEWNYNQLHVLNHFSCLGAALKLVYD